jgi:hypothetical protein
LDFQLATLQEGCKNAIETKMKGKLGAECAIEKGFWQLDSLG